MRKQYDYLLYNRFYLVLILRFLASSGTWVTGVAAMMVIYKRDSSIAPLSTILFLRYAPIIVLSSFSGIVIRRFNKKRAVFFFEFLKGLSTLPMILHPSLSMMYLSIFLIASLEAFSYPAFNAFIPLAMKKEWLVKANASLSIGKMTAQLIGPSLASFLLFLFHYKVAFAFNAFTFFIFSVLILTVPSQKEDLEGIENKTNSRCEGSFFWGENSLAYIGILCEGFAFVVSGTLSVLQLLFFTQVFCFPTNYYGYLLSLLGAGAILSGFLCKNFSIEKSVFLYFGGMFFYGFTLILYSLSTVACLGMALLLFLGLFQSMMVIGGRSYLQAYVDSSSLAKVMAQRNLAEKTGGIIGIGVASLFPTKYQLSVNRFMFIAALGYILAISLLCLFGRARKSI